MKVEPGWELPEYSEDVYRERRTRYATIIPVLNEGERIRTQLQRMREFSTMADVIIVDGGSTDGALAPEFLRDHEVRTLIHKLGSGRLSAQLRLGLAYALAEGYEGVILIDGNNKDNPAAIPDFIRMLDAGYDHVQGSRFRPGGKAIHNPAMRLWGIRLVHAPLISLAAGVRYTDTTNGFRGYSRRLLADPRVRPLRHIFSAYELHYYLAIRAARVGLKVIEIPVEREYPAEGPMPSKIKGVRGNAKIMRTLIDACLHRFDPGQPRR